MPTPSTTIIHPTKSIPDDAPEQRQGWLDALLQRDRLWLLLIIVILAALFLGGCHARSENCHVQASYSSCEADGLVAAFYVVYLLSWIIVSSCGG